MISESNWFVKTDDGKVYGPASVSQLVAWTKDGRIEPTSMLSQDRTNWSPAPLMPELEMKWIVETELGRLYGPFNYAVVSRLINDKMVPPTARIYRLYDGTEESGAITVVNPQKVAVNSNGLFRGVNREQLSALEAAARRELLAMKKCGAVINLFGSKKK